MLRVSTKEFWRGVRGLNPHALRDATDYKSVGLPVSLTPRQNGVTGRFSPTSPCQQQGVLGVMNYGHTRTMRGSRPTRFELATFSLARSRSVQTELRARSAHGNLSLASRRTNTALTVGGFLLKWGCTNQPLSGQSHQVFAATGVSTTGELRSNKFIWIGSARQGR